jgi:hypothetical protein
MRSFVKYCFHHEKIKFISSRRRNNILYIPATILIIVLSWQIPCMSCPSCKHSYHSCGNGSVVDKIFYQFLSLHKPINLILILPEHRSRGPMRESACVTLVNYLKYIRNDQSTSKQNPQKGGKNGMGM